MQLLGPLPDFVSRFRARFKEERCEQTAASLAFTTLLGIVPFLAVALILISRFELFAGFSEAVRSFLLANMLPEKAGKVIAGYALKFSYKAESLNAIGFVMIVVTAVLLMLSVEQAFNRIWRVHQPRALWRRLAIYGGILVLGPIALGASLAVSSYLFTVSLGLVNEPKWVTNLMLKTMPIATLAMLFGVLYYVLPNRATVKWHAVMGGLIAALGFAVTQKLFSLYLAKFSTYTEIYGVFGTTPIFLIWLYLSWLVVVMGALVAAVLDDISPAKGPGIRAKIAGKLRARTGKARAKQSVLG